MHRRSLNSVSLILVVSLFSAAAAFADTIQGRVATANRNLVDLTVYDGQGRPYPNALHLKVDSRTRFSGVSNASSLRMGDAVQTDVSRETSGQWRADAMTKLQGGLQTIQYAKSPSPNLMDALKSPTGQKVVRNGLMGALTGAVASGTSGGKAGKGALIGAGVGVLGGFLSDILGQPRQTQTQAQPVTVTDGSGRN